MSVKSYDKNFKIEVIRLSRNRAKSAGFSKGTWHP